MSLARSINRRAREAVPPLIFLSLVAYFVFQAMHGERGLDAYARRSQDLQQAKAELAAANADMASWDRRVASLRPDRMDPDALDERVRAMLNLSDPGDVTILYPSGQKLF